MITPSDKNTGLFSKPHFWVWVLVVFIVLLIALIAYFHYQVKAIDTELNNL